MIWCLHNGLVNFQTLQACVRYSLRFRRLRQDVSETAPLKRERLGEQLALCVAILQKASCDSEVNMCRKGCHVECSPDLQNSVSTAAAGLLPQLEQVHVDHLVLEENDEDSDDDVRISDMLLQPQPLDLCKFRKSISVLMHRKFAHGEGVSWGNSNEQVA